MQGLQWFAHFKGEGRRYHPEFANLKVGEGGRGGNEKQFCALAFYNISGRERTMAKKSFPKYLSLQKTNVFKLVI